MSDELAFTRAICENPECDTTRLVYADWLEEHGQPERAEFIRDTRGNWTRVYGFFEADVLAAIPSAKPAGFGKEDDAKGGRPRWGFNLPDCRPIGYGFVLYDRGFVSEIHLPTQAFLKHAATIFARHPVTVATLTGHEPVVNSDDRFIWIRASAGDDPRRLISWEVPFELWDDSDECFETADAAYDWLSRRCVTWGRAQVKPPLPEWQPRKGVPA